MVRVGAASMALVPLSCGQGTVRDAAAQTSSSDARQHNKAIVAAALYPVMLECNRSSGTLIARAEVWPTGVIDSLVIGQQWFSLRREDKTPIVAGKTKWVDVMALTAWQSRHRGVAALDLRDGTLTLSMAAYPMPWRRGHRVTLSATTPDGRPVPGDRLHSSITGYSAAATIALLC